MIRFFSLFFSIICVFSMPVSAQENADDVLAEQGMVSENAPIKPIETEENYEKRLELSRKMHEIWPKRPKVESALEQISEQIEPQERLRFKAGMRKAIEFDALEEGSIDAMADIFSAKELEAMIAFYGSKEGRSVSHKTSDYEKALIPLVTKMIDKALLDVKLGSE
mgnify:CR=1 FL=1